MDADLVLPTPCEEETLVALAEGGSDGRPPTVRDLAKHLGLRSTLWAFQLLSRLVEKGYAVRRAGARAIGLTEAGEEMAAALTGGRGGLIPIMGRVAAGTPIFTPNHVDGVLKVDRSAIQARGPLFALRVKGDSMIGDAILDGDFVLVHEQPRLDPGEIGVVAVGEEATVKRVYPRRGGWELRPSNPRYKPIRVGADEDVKVCGKVVGVIRGRVR